MTEETTPVEGSFPGGVKLPSAWNYGAIEKALRDCEGGQKENIFELAEIVSVHEFEERWGQILVEFNLQNNQFLPRAYGNRDMWAKAYFRETFCAGMTSTQRSESANHMLKTYVPRSAPMHLFLSQYNRMIADRVAEEGREEHATKQVRRVLRAGVPLEKRAAKFYTRAMFDRFSKELFRSGAYKCTTVEDGDSYDVDMLYGTRSDGAVASFKVRCSPDRQDYFCECKSFEHCGMPCRHILKVLVHEGVRDMPLGLYLPRWGRDAALSSSVNDGGVSDLVSHEARLATLHSAVYASAMELVGMAMKSRAGVVMCMGYLSQVKEAISCLIVKDTTIPELSAEKEDAEAGAQGNEEETVLAPPRVRSRGCPKEKRMKPFAEIALSGKRKSTMSAGGSRVTRSKVAAVDTTSTYGNTTTPRCRVCYSTEHAVSNCPENEEPLTDGPTARKCHLCGEIGHYRSTCGRKSSYSRQS